MQKKTAEKRRSIYALGKLETLSSDEIIKIIRHSVKHCPTAFNSQSARVLILFEKSHEKLWDIVLDTLQAMLAPDIFSKSKERIDNCFKSGYGTILYFNDDETTNNLQEKFPLYKDNFPIWGEQANGMLQYLIWNSLAEKNIGASLQHYNPIIDEKVKAAWNIPQNWRLIAQMPFGSIEAPAAEKTFLPIEDMVKVYE